MQFISLLSLFISIITIITVISLYFKNKKLTFHLHNKIKEFSKDLFNEKQSSDRINNVIDSFLDLYNSNKDTGVLALIRSGIKNLETEDEIVEAISVIQNRIGENPLGSMIERIKEVGLFKFFKIATLNSIKKDGIEECLKRVKKL